MNCSTNSETSYCFMIGYQRIYTTAHGNNHRNAKRLGQISRVVLAYKSLTVGVPLQNLTGLTDMYLVFLILLVAGRVASRKKSTRGIFHDVGYTIQ